MIEQSQAFCHRCGRPTLHQLATKDTPHGLHLALTVIFAVLTAGIGLLWIVVWFGHAMLNAFTAGPHRCTVCGQAAGALTEEKNAELNRRFWAALRWSPGKEKKAGATLPSKSLPPGDAIPPDVQEFLDHQRDAENVRD